MFQTAPGVTIPFPEKIQEQFQVYEGQSIRANISFEKLKSLLTEFYQSLPEPLFFVLQLPLSIQEERQLGHDKILHQEVCYLDGQTRDQMDSILNTYGQILLEDGMSQFAIASHVNHEEIFIQKYKLTDLYSPSPRRFIPLLQRYGLTETDRLFTVWDTFSQETPGECRRISIQGLDAYAIAERLKEKGMYRARIIEG
jgi:hypothetical protein